MSGKSSYHRQLKALVNFLPNADLQTYTALGGKASLDWANSVLDQVPDEMPGPGMIQVLGLPYGGPNGGRDNEGQYFSPSTDFLDGVIDTPPVMYTHGTQNGFSPEPVGTTKSRWYDRRGGWFGVELDPQHPRYTQLVDAHATGNLRASTGVVPASYSANPATGHIDSWLVGELSLVDLRDGYAPINGYAITKAAANETLFTDYYGNAVVAEAPSMWSEIKQVLSDLLIKLANAEADEEAQETAEDAAKETAANVAEVILGEVKAGDFGGHKRSDLADGDFVFSDERKFPIVDQEDLNSAVRLWGQYKGPHSRAEFMAGVRRLAAKHKLTLPDSFSKAEEVTMEGQVEEAPCTQCDEAKRLAAEVRAEIAVEPVQKCARCPQAVEWVRSMVKAGKVKPAEAFAYLDTFSESDATFDEIKAEVEGRVIAPAKAQVFIAGGQQIANLDDVVDEGHMNKQRRLAGLPVK